MRLSNKEIYMLSDGLLALIQNESEAVKLTNSDNARRYINRTIDKYQDLNSKILRFADRQSQRVKTDIEMLDGLDAKQLHQYMKIRMRGDVEDEQIGE